MKKKTVDFMVEPQVCFDHWRICKDERPTRKTLYASTYGVSVLGFNLHEYLDSGSCNPFDVVYFFRKKRFLTIAHGGTGTIWVDAGITHWMPLPPGPVLKIKPNLDLIKQGISSTQRPDRTFNFFEKERV